MTAVGTSQQISSREFTVGIGWKAHIGGEVVSAEPVAIDPLRHQSASHVAVAKPVAKRVLPGNACVSNASESDQTTLRVRTRVDGSCRELPSVLQKAEVTRMITPVRESSGEIPGES